MALNKDLREQNIKFFDRWSLLYGFDPITVWLRCVQYVVLKQIPLSMNMSVLDVGCGPGHGLSFFVRRGIKNIAGIDLSPKMMSRAKKRLGNTVVLKTASVEKIPFPRNTFSLVVNTEAFHHFPNPDNAVKEIFRVLKPGGRLYLADINFFSIFIHFLFKKFEPGHVKIYNNNEFRDLFKKNNLKVIMQKRIGLFAILTIGKKC